MIFKSELEFYICKANTIMINKFDTNSEIMPDNRARKSRVYLAWRYEIHAIIGSFGTVRAQPRFRSHVKSMGDFRLLQLTVI